MMLKCRRIILLLVIICILPLLSGCRKIDVRSETVINDDESGQIDLYVRYNDILSPYIKGNIFDCEWADNNGYAVRKHAEGSDTVEELIYEFDNLEELEEKVNSSGLVELSHSDKIQCDKRTYNFNLVCNKANIEALLSKSIHTGDEAKDRYVMNYLENITIHNDIRYHDSKIRPDLDNIVSGIDIRNCRLSQFEEKTNISFCIQ